MNMMDAMEYDDMISKALKDKSRKRKELRRNILASCDMMFDETGTLPDSFHLTVSPETLAIILDALED